MPCHTHSDSELIQIVDAATADASRRAGSFLACHAGCAQCCTGVFAISQLDAARLRLGMRELQLTDPERAARVRERVSAAVQVLSPDFPGDVESGILGTSDHEAEAFEEFGNEQVCPALDPVSKTCDLYRYRPMTCRIFGLPVETEDGIGVCELCFVGATPEEIVSSELHLNIDELESLLLSQVEQETGVQGETIVAFALKT